jgi:hypothetical protein
VILLAFTVGVGLLAGYARGGRLANLGRVDLHRTWLVGVAVVAQLLLTGFSATATPVHLVAPVLLLTSNLALIAFVWSNRLLPGMTLIFAGFALNALVITANGGMPVSREALIAVLGGSGTFTPGKHRVLEPGDRLAVLGDVLPIPVLKAVVSIGDIVLAAGAGVLIANLMLRHPDRRRRRRRSAQHTARIGPGMAPHRNGRR